jgi:hypothetical protein
VFSDEPTERLQFVCPGQRQPVTPAVHRARLSAGWNVCDGCEWRLHTEGLSERSAAQAEFIREQRVAGIERTEFGVRGMWLNALTPTAAALLAQVFSLSLAERWQERQPKRFAESSAVARGRTADAAMQAAVASRGGAKADAGTVPAEFAPLPELLIACDSRSFSAEVFVGVVAAVRELGLPVLDAGRSTAAMLQEVLRCHSRLAGALFVTGAGAPAGWSGLDAIDMNGDGVQVVWRDFGVALRSGARQSGASQDSQGALRISLDLPETGHGSRAMRRLSRTAGHYRSLDFEQRYRDWLKGWHAGSSSQRLLVGTDDGLVKQRVQWLAEHAGWSLAVCSAAEARSAASSLSFEVLEDDRWFVLRKAGGGRVAAEELAQRLNSSAAGSRTSQLTAHADPVTGRLWFSDAARPGNAGMTERVEDALAAAGVLLGTSGLLAELQSGNLQGNRRSPPPGAC